MDKANQRTDWYLRGAELRRRAQQAATSEEQRKWLVLAESCDDMAQLFEEGQQNQSRRRPRST